MIAGTVATNCPIGSLLELVGQRIDSGEIAPNLGWYCLDSPDHLDGDVIDQYYDAYDMRRDISGIVVLTARQENKYCVYLRVLHPTEGHLVTALNLQDFITKYIRVVL